MAASLRNKRINSLPAINMNKFFVSKRASMFETFEETPREKRDRSPCGLLEISERKLEARKEKEKKEAMVSRKKRQADPYAEESTEIEEDDQLGIETKICPHASRSVNLNLVRKSFKQINPIRECTSCRRGKDSLTSYNNTLLVEDSEQAKKGIECVIWLCCYCGHQGCDRNSRDKHAYYHYKTPRSDSHCLVLNVHTWTVWCYECDCEAVQTSSKKLHEVVNFVKRQSEMAPRRTINAMHPTATRHHTTNLTTQFSGSDSRLHLSSNFYEDTSKSSKNNKNYQASVLAALPKVKGLTNLGNTCFFNSVLQNLSQTHYLTQILDIHVQKGQRITLPGRRKFANPDDERHSRSDRKTRDSSKYINGEHNDSSESEQETEDTIELCAQGNHGSHFDSLNVHTDGSRPNHGGSGCSHPSRNGNKKSSNSRFSCEKPLDLYLSEGGTLSTSLGLLLKELHCVGKSSIINPGHLFSLICKKSLQFQGYQQQDAHELLRCLLDAVRNEEIIRIKKSILKSFGYSEKTDPNSVPSRLKKVIKGYGKQASNTLIEEIFGGQLISTVFCEECHWSSQVFESFMDLSLPINEEKGKPKKSNSFEDDGIFDCFGRSLNSHSNNSQNGSNMSKYQRKKQKANNRRKKKAGRSTKSSELILPCIKVNSEDKDEDKLKTKKERRLTEKRRPEDMEEFRLKQEAEKKAREDRLKVLEERKKRKGESNKFKMLMQVRSTSKNEMSGEEMEGGESGEEEELEYDPEEDDDDDNSFGIERRSLKHKPSNPVQNINDTLKLKSSSSVEDEEEEEEEEVEDEEDEEDDETEANDTSSDASSSRNSKTMRISRENSDADVEDNTDSEYMRNSYRQNTRQPSIVIDESVSDYVNSDSIDVNNRYLRTSNSYDQLNYNSCSDTSERYFTAAGIDTMDELDHGYGGDTISFQSDRTSSTVTTSSGKGDSISMSSGDLYCQYDDHKSDKRLIVDQGHIDEMCRKVGELKISRKSSSRENLLESNPKAGHKRGSTETLHTFKNDRIEDEEPVLKKSQTIRRLKQEWISRSLTTLAPRYQGDRQECSVMSCLSNFTSPELLTGNNKITCENCSKLQSYSSSDNKSKPVKSNASKQLLILSPPAILTLHLKRFHHVGYNLCKVNKYVQFPVVLDVAPFTSSISLGLGNMTRGQSQVIYVLFGVVEHSGRLNSGHYVAYVRSRPFDTQRTSKHFLNMKPSSQYEINHLVNEMAEKIEAEGGPINKTLKPSHSSNSTVNIEELEEEVRSGRWYHVSDSYVAEVTYEKVTKAQAYLLFYERIL